MTGPQEDTNKSMSEWEFLIPVIIMDTTGNKIIKKDIEDLNNIITKVEKVNTYKTLYPIGEQRVYL